MTIGSDRQMKQFRPKAETAYLYKAWVKWKKLVYFIFTNFKLVICNIQTTSKI